MSWKWFAVGSAFFAGITAVFAKMGVQQIPTALATLWRTVVIGLLLIGVVGARGEWRMAFTLPAKSLGFLTLSALTTGLSWLCYYRALKTGPVGLVSAIDKASLAVAIFLAVLFLGERFSPLQWLASGLIGLGVVLLVLAP